MSVQDALENSYLSTYHDPGNEPVAKTVFKADFEDMQMTKDKLRQLVWSEVLNFHPSLREDGSVGPTAPTSGAPQAKRHRVAPPGPGPRSSTQSNNQQIPGECLQGQWVQSTGEAQPYGQQ